MYDDKLLQQGDVLFCDPEPLVAGHEQNGRRPVLVVSNESFNSHTGLVKVVAITSTTKTFPTRVKIPKGEIVHGDILTDQEKTIDPEARHVVVKGKLSNDVIESVISLISKSY
ncbi:type II toxin-antitoxin system PemK/MazF family toxin [Fructilactobacillus sp. Tb1]|uniref:type II toxin-antitoxin system PemK/MazF family toxin n=1 Tax=Fructilactobacillus sp. Tb1 TaxID=3422304 RepID=UPI003D2AC287